MPTSDEDLEEFGLGYAQQDTSQNAGARGPQGVTSPTGTMGLQGPQGAIGPIGSFGFPTGVTKLYGLPASNNSDAAKHALDALRNELNNPSPRPKGNRNSTQIGIKCQGTFTPADWNGTVLPTINGVRRTMRAFKPTKILVSERLVATFCNSVHGLVKRNANPPDPSDLVLMQAFAGVEHCFPAAIDPEYGIPGLNIGNRSLGSGISWPAINGGLDVKMVFGVEQTVLYQVQPPQGYTSGDLTSIEVIAIMNLLGPSL